MPIMKNAIRQAGAVPTKPHWKAGYVIGGGSGTPICRCPQCGICL
jgi:hypothetical protein